VPRVHLPQVIDARSRYARKGLRAAIALPGMLAIVDALTGDVTLALFSAFGAFALVALADFGGPPRARVRAYLLATLTGALLIAAGTLTSEHAIAAGMVGFLVGFALMQTAAFGGAWAAAMFALALSYVLSATLPGTLDDIPARVAGWGIGGLVATALALLVLPVYERPTLLHAAADALRAAVAYLRSGGAAAARDAARAAVEHLHAEYAATPYRPSGPAVRDRAFLATMDGLDRLVDVEAPGAGEPGDPDGSLREAAAKVLESCAERLDDDQAPDPELGALDAARHEHRDALAAWARRSLRGGSSPTEVLAGIERAWWTRVMSFFSVAIAADVVINVGGAPLDDGLATTLETPVDRSGTRGERLARVLRTNLDLSSVRFRNALRTAVGLGLAVLVADLLSIDHGFWVGLATLSVLRSNALATGRTALQAIGGTCLGFAVILVFFGVFDAGPTAEWVALPIAAFFAAYAPSAISYLIGQLSFTVAIVLMFDVIEPEGWRTGLVRVEDIAIGAAVSLVVGLLLWPRGAFGLLRSVLARHLRADADYLDEALAGVTSGTAPPSETCREHARAAARRVGDAYDELLAAPGTVPSDHESWAAIAGAARMVEAACDLLVAQTQLAMDLAAFPEAGRALGHEADELTEALRGVGDALTARRCAPSIPDEPSEARRRAEVEVLERWGGRDEAGAGAAVGVVWASEVLHAADLAVRRAASATDELRAEDPARG